MENKYISKGIKFVYLTESKSFKLGKQHGEILKDEINALVNALKNYGGSKFSKPAALLITPLLLKSTRILVKKFSKELRKEMDGIAFGAKVNKEWIYLINSTYELGTISDRYLHFSSCSSFMDFNQNTEKFFIGKTTDVISDIEFTKPVSDNRIIFIYLNKGNKYLTSTMPGLVVGDWGLSSSGNFIGFNDGGVFTSKHNFKLDSVINLLREIYKNSNNLDKAREKILEAKIYHPFISILSDGSPNNSYTFEIGEDEVAEYKFDKKPSLNTNFFKTKKFQKKLYPNDYKSDRQYISAEKRYLNLKKLIKNCFKEKDYLEIIKYNNGDFDFFNGAISSMATISGVLYNATDKYILLPSKAKIPVTYYGKWNKFTIKEIFG